VTQFEGVVLAGGASARMGTNKAFLPFQGAPLYHQSVRALQDSGAANVAIVGGPEPEGRAADVRWRPDDTPGAGPLLAVASVLRQAVLPHVVVLSCDLPAIGAREVSLVRSCMGDADVAVPVVNGHRQWMTTVWRAAVSPVLDDAIASGERRLWAAARGLRTVLVFDFDTTGYADVDTPDELAVAKNRASGAAG